MSDFPDPVFAPVHNLCFETNMPSQEIKTDRLLLRRWRESDVAPFAAICGDPEVMKFIADGGTRSPEQVEREINQFESAWETDGFGLFAVELIETGEFIGFAGLSRPKSVPEIMPAVEIGWRFGRQHWGKGYASEAARAVLAFGLNEIGLGKIVSIYQVENLASQRIMEKLGMIFDRETVVPTYGRTVRVYRTP